MKKLLYLFLGLSLTVVSCSKDDDGGDGGSAGAGTITAKVDGDSFTSMEIATTATEQTTSGVTSIRVQGSNSDGKGITLFISGFDGTGTYEIGGGDNIFTNALYLDADINNPLNSQTWSAPYDENLAGEIQVSEKTDTNIKGTFSFKAKSGNDDSLIEVTNGSFNVSFQ